ncbi:hypothetical protein [Aquabacterium sp. J223]|uniref:hypothetical protein n=1 Tax=Aquabacterium sp. J223 TaxID=2898431 RepID=UPI0021ADDA1E|nr:hypothetical protein [Aquabacterium sp. J223]UUX94830.1 hypothetical protein LRS07_16335 [Aquabacterium sp. J223]
MPAQLQSSFPRGLWVDLCILQLLDLSPGVPPQTLHTMAELLWHEVPFLLPREAAAIEVMEWESQVS